MGFPIRTSRDYSFIASSPALFAGLHVLRRLSSPRHPPDALIHLTLSFQELLWLCLTFRWLEHQTWISYSDKAYCLLCLNPAFCLSGLSRYNHHPNTAPVFLFLSRRQLTVCNRSIIKNRHIVFVCWFRLSNLLKIDAFNIAIYFANQNELIIIAAFLFPSNWFVSRLLFGKKESSYTAFLTRFDLESIGGGKRDRTDDPLLAKQVLYQLSYAPVLGGSGRTWTSDPTLIKRVL